MSQPSYTMSPEQFQDQMIGLVVTLCKLYEKQGYTPMQAREEVASYLYHMSQSLVKLEEESNT